MDIHDWKETVLWKTIEVKTSPETESVKSTLNQCMADIQQVLSAGGTAPADFTLHDAGHAFRVAQRMATIIPIDVLPLLNSYEIGLLLLSAYLHDIGMTPERRKVQLHHQYLMTGNPQDLDELDLDEFQIWLDNEHDGITPPVCSHTPSVKDIHHADELITYYCRYRHNDWGEEWTRKNLSKVEATIYVGWLDDLVALCRSHHDGYQELKSAKFNPRPVPPHANVINLRYLACALRMADILEFDPERTPEVILRHRNISKQSLIFWWKDHQISLKLEDKRLVFSARPPNAQLHRALETTANEIDEELRLCRALADETHFQQCPGLEAQQPHRWDLLPSLHRDIVPKENSYVYIDGSFRPDTQKVLQLLSGVELYRTPMIAVRELLQNAFDAIKEQIAYERLAKSNSADPSLLKNLSKLHHVKLTLEKRSDGFWLICKDDGIGMTKTIIRDHFLISGSSKRHDVLSLERKCKAKGFTLGRTGQFGIGVLSFFMLGSQVKLKTLRSQSPGDAEGHGWSFETRGIGSFGELRKIPMSNQGSEIALQLKPEEIRKGPLEFFAELRAYLVKTIALVPCQFEFNSMIPGCEVFSLNPGWARNKKFFTKQLVGTISSGNGGFRKRPPSHLLSLSSRNEFDQEDRNWEDIRSEIKEVLRWETIKGERPAGFGSYRIHLPYFELPDGISLGFLRVQKTRRKIYIKKIGSNHCWTPTIKNFLSWKGMDVEFSEKRGGYGGKYVDKRLGAIVLENSSSLNYGAVIEIELESPEAGKIHVDRNSLHLGEKGEETLKWVQRKTINFCSDFVQKNRKSAFYTLNCRITGILPEKGTVTWIDSKENNDLEIEWKAVKFPLINRMVFLEKESLPNIQWKKKNVNIISALELCTGSYFTLTQGWNSTFCPPDRIVTLPYYSPKIVGLWTSASRLGTLPILPWLPTQFPKNWENLCGFQLEHFNEKHKSRFVWNTQHPLIKSLTVEAWEWCDSILGPSYDPLPKKEEILSQKSRCASWVLICIEENFHELWNGLKERDPTFLKNIWCKFFPKPIVSRNGYTETPLIFGNYPDYDFSLCILNPDQWKVSQERDDFNFYLPDPGPDWKLGIQRTQKSLFHVPEKPIKKKIITRKSTGEPWWTKGFEIYI